MIRALLADLAGVNGVQVTTLRDARLSTDLPGEVRRCVSAETFPGAFTDAVGDSDAVWLIAPETDGWLERLCIQIQERHRGLLNCSPDAIRIAASKWETCRVLKAGRVPVVPSFRAIEEVCGSAKHIVMKPDDGAGCVDTFLFSKDDAPASVSRNAVFQPYLEGEPRSFAMLCSNAGAELLCVNRQLVERKGNALTFTGVETGVIADHDGEMACLAERIWKCIPGMRGFVGVDYVQTRAGPVVLEINPRLTSAYRGMSERLGFNVAARIVDMSRSGRL